MTIWHPDTPSWYAETADRVCTPKQLEVLKLASGSHDLSDQQIATRLGISRQAVQQRRDSGTKRVADTPEGREAINRMLTNPGPPLHRLDAA